MKLHQLSQRELRRALKATLPVTGPDSPEVRALTRELARRRAGAGKGLMRLAAKIERRAK